MAAFGRLDILVNVTGSFVCGAGRPGSWCTRAAAAHRQPALLFGRVCQPKTATRHADGSPLPEFVEQEFSDFLTCGVLAHGFARLRYTDCAIERLVPFSCQGRDFCTSSASQTTGRRSDS